MKKILKVAISIIIMVSLCGQIMISFADKKTANSLYGDNMLEYLQGDNDNLLLNRKNYVYMNLVENFKSNGVACYCLKILDTYTKIGAEPNKEKYIEILLNIIATYDLDNASSIAEQYKIDNKKTFKDYTLDFVRMSNDVVSIVNGNSSSVSQLESSIAIAIDGLSVLAKNTDNWITAISNLETIIQNYEKYDGFLELIEEKSEGELKEAATILRKGMSEAIEIKLSTYIEVSNENFENYSEFFFSDVFFTILKQSPQYSSDENMKFFVDCGDNIVTKIGTLKSSLDLGVMIGKLVGNIAVGGENKVNRLLEMMALHDISVILQGEIIDLSNEFIEKYGSEDEEAVIERYVLYSQYLVDCRIRGEYCIYSVVADDAGLLSWFNKEDAEDAKLWYENKVKKILSIQNKLLDINNIEFIINNVEFEHYYDDSGEYGIFIGKTDKGNTVWVYETKHYEPTELDQIVDIGLKNSIYYLSEAGKIITLDLRTGNILWENSDFGGAGISYTFDDNGILYVCGFYGPDLHIIDQNGITIERYEEFVVDGIRYYWPYEMKYKDGCILIKYDMSDETLEIQDPILVYDIINGTVSNFYSF